MNLCGRSAVTHAAYFSFTCSWYCPREGQGSVQLDRSVNLRSSENEVEQDAKAARETLLSGFEFSYPVLRLIVCKGCPLMKTTTIKMFYKCWVNNDNYTVMWKIICLLIKWMVIISDVKERIRISDRISWDRISYYCMMLFKFWD